MNEPPNAGPSFGRLARLDEPAIWKKLWPREDPDLNRWMSANIELLNGVLGLQIDIDEAESAVGPFRLDLAGNETLTQKPIVIENQFGKTDHDHLGKLITYAASREAGILVWVAMDFQDAHRTALKWLISITGQK